MVCPNCQEDYGELEVCPKPECNKFAILGNDHLKLIGRYLPIPALGQFAQANKKTSAVFAAELGRAKDVYKTKFPKVAKKAEREGTWDGTGIGPSAKSTDANFFAEIEIERALARLGQGTYGYWDKMTEQQRSEYAVSSGTPDYVLWGDVGDAYTVNWPKGGPVPATEAHDTRNFENIINSAIKGIREKWTYSDRSFCVLNLSTCPERIPTQRFLNAILERMKEIGRGADQGSAKKQNRLFLFRNGDIIPVCFNDGDEKSYVGKRE